MCLQDEAGGDLPAADGRHELFQLGDLADIRHFVDQAPHMHGQPAAVLIVRFFAEQVEHLGIRHGYQEIEGIVRVRDDEEHRRFCVSDGVQLQFVIGSNLPNLLNIKGSKTRRTGNQDAFGRLA